MRVVSFQLEFDTPGCSLLLYQCFSNYLHSFQHSVFSTVVFYLLIGWITMLSPWADSSKHNSRRTFEWLSTLDKESFQTSQKKVEPVGKTFFMFRYFFLLGICRFLLEDPYKQLFFHQKMHKSRVLHVSEKFNQLVSSFDQTTEILNTLDPKRT